MNHVHGRWEEHAPSRLSTRNERGEIYRRVVTGLSPFAPHGNGALPFATRGNAFASDAAEKSRRICRSWTFRLRGQEHPLSLPSPGACRVLLSDSHLLVVGYPSRPAFLDGFRSPLVNSSWVRTVNGSRLFSPKSQTLRNDCDLVPF